VSELKNRWFIAIFLGLSIGLLSGCNQVEDLLDQAIQLLNQQSSDDNETNVEEAVTDIDASEDNNNDDSNVEESEESSTENVSEPEIPFDERLLAQGYDNKVLPNGFPFTVPYHWILVEDNIDDPSAQGFEGTFCFDIPMEVEQIAEGFVDFHEITHEHHGEENDIIHTTTFTIFPEPEGWNGTMEYFLDEYENTCATVMISFGGSDGEEEQYGEDPETMVSEEALAAMQEQNDSEDYENGDGIEDGVYEDRERSLPDDYDKKLNLHREPDDLVDMDVDADDIESIRDKIRNGEIEMLHLMKGYPRIFPYEWYLLKEDDDPVNSSWSGTFCTDAQMGPTIIKHHDMLAEHNADIIDFSINGSPQMNEKSTVEFAFNDEYGTGSWHGNTQFYIDRNQEFQVHKCANVSMEFSPDLLQ